MGWKMLFVRMIQLCCGRVEATHRDIISAQQLRQMAFLMLGSCLLWEIFRMMPSSFCARKKLDKWYNLGAVVILIPLVSYSLLFML